MCQARTCGRVLARGRTPSAPKQWTSDVHVKSQNPVSARSPLTKSKKKYREGSNIKSGRVSALTGSVPHKMAAALQKDSAPCGNRTHVSKLSTTSLNHSTIGSYQLLEKKRYMTRHNTWTVELFRTAFLGAELSISDSSGWISRLGKQYRNSWTQTYDQYILSHST